MLEGRDGQREGVPEQTRKLSAFRYTLCVCYVVFKSAGLNAAYIMEESRNGEKGKKSRKKSNKQKGKSLLY